MRTAYEYALAYLGALIGAAGGITLTVLGGWQLACVLLVVYALTGWWHLRRVTKEAKR